MALNIKESALDRAEREAAQFAFEHRTMVDVRTLAIVTAQAERVIRDGIEAGTIPSVRVGRSIRIPTAPLRRAWGLD